MTPLRPLRQPLAALLALCLPLAAAVPQTDGGKAKSGGAEQLGPATADPLEQCKQRAGEDGVKNLDAAFSILSAAADQLKADLQPQPQQPPRPVPPPTGPATSGPAPSPPPGRPVPPSPAQIDMALGNMKVAISKANEFQSIANEKIAAAERTRDPAERQRLTQQAAAALNARDGIVAQQLSPMAPQRAAIAPEKGPTYRLLESMAPPPTPVSPAPRPPPRDYRTEYDGAIKRTIESVSQGPQTKFFTLPEAVRSQNPAPPPLDAQPGQLQPPRVNKYGTKHIIVPSPTLGTPTSASGREPGGIKFSSAQAAQLAATLDVSSVAFDAARGRIVLEGNRTSQTFDLEIFADVLRLAVETNEPFFSLDASDPAQKHAAFQRTIDELHKVYRPEQLHAAVMRKSGTPFVRGSTTFYYTTADAIDPELVRRATQGFDNTTRLVFSPAWLRQSKVGWILYEADVAIKAVAAGFVERDGVVQPVPGLWNLPDFRAQWTEAAVGSATTGRANFELPHVTVTRSVGRIDLTEIHPALYVTATQPGTAIDTKPSASDERISDHFSRHWKSYVENVPEIARLDMVFRAYVAARFLAEYHPGLKSKILSLPRSLPPEQPPLLIMMPVVMRVAMQNGRPAPVDGGGSYFDFSMGYGGGIAMATGTKSGESRPRVEVKTVATTPGEWWSGLWAAAWYDGRYEAVDSAKGTSAVAIDFEGGDMPGSWHAGTLTPLAVLALALAGMATVLRRADFQHIAIAQSCARCARSHGWLGTAALAADAVALTSLAYLIALPLVASAYETTMGWRELGLTVALLAVLLAMLALLGLLLRSVTELVHPAAPRDQGIALAVFSGARLAAVLAPLWLFHAGFGVSAVGSAMAAVLTPPVAERSFAMSGGALPVLLASVGAAGGAVLALACRWLGPFLLGSRPLPLFRFSPIKHAHHS